MFTSGKCARFRACLSMEMGYALLGCLIASVTAIPTIEVKGGKFFTSEGSQFYIKGVAYAPSLTDVNNLVDGEQCKRDAKLIAELGANLVRVYSVDPTLNHDACMSAFEDEGIYVLIDFTTPMISINRNDPEWTVSLRDAFAQVIDGFAKYDNLMGFFCGNEVINDVATTSAAVFVKAAIADMKAYRDLQGYRRIPIGYSSVDDTKLRTLQMDYFNCGPSESSADFFAANVYSWCNSDSTFTSSGYDTLYSEAEGYPIPYFLSETGCNIGTGSEPNRTFSDQISLLGRNMNDRFSGNIIYEWSQGENNYGLVSYSGESIRTFNDYSRLKDMWKTLSPAGVQKDQYEPTSTTRSCPESTSKTWLVAKNAPLPTIGLSGLTTPTAPRYTSTAAQTGTTSRSNGAEAAETTNSIGRSSPTGEPNSSSGLPAGGIAGVVLGSLVVVGVVLGAILFCLRRKRKHLSAPSNTDSDGPRNAESDKIVVIPRSGTDKNVHVDYYGPNYAELPPNQDLPELAPAKGYTVQMAANELANHDPTAYNGIPTTSGGSWGHPELSSYEPNARVPEPSPHVQRQREIEIDWLESEESRLRQRRELLRQQGST